MRVLVNVSTHLWRGHQNALSARYACIPPMSTKPSQRSSTRAGDLRRWTVSDACVVGEQEGVRPWQVSPSEHTRDMQRLERRLQDFTLGTVGIMASCAHVFLAFSLKFAFPGEFCEVRKRPSSGASSLHACISWGRLVHPRDSLHPSPGVSPLTVANEVGFSGRELDVYRGSKLLVAPSCAGHGCDVYRMPFQRPEDASQGSGHDLHRPQCLSVHDSLLRCISLRPMALPRPRSPSGFP